MTCKQHSALLVVVTLDVLLLRGLVIEQCGLVLGVQSNQLARLLNWVDYFEMLVRFVINEVLFERRYDLRFLVVEDLGNCPVVVVQLADLERDRKLN